MIIDSAGPEGHRPLDGDRGGAPRPVRDDDRGGSRRARLVGRTQAARRGCRTATAPHAPPCEIDPETLAKAVLAARVLEYAQGFRILAAASDTYDWQLDAARIAEIWRAGCIIRAAMLDDIAGAFRDGPDPGSCCSRIASRKRSRRASRPCAPSSDRRSRGFPGTRPRRGARLVRHDAHAPRHRRGDPGAAGFLRASRFRTRGPGWSAPRSLVGLTETLHP